MRRPPACTVNAAPSSPPVAKSSANASRTGSKPGATDPFMKRFSSISGTAACPLREERAPTTGQGLPRLAKRRSAAGRAEDAREVVDHRDQRQFRGRAALTPETDAI